MGNHKIENQRMENDKMNTADATPHNSSEYIEIALTKGFVAYVDLKDFDRVKHNKWHFSGYAGAKGRAIGYAYTMIGGNKASMHRWILGIFPGDPRIVGHKNGHGLDNRRSNLVVVWKHSELNNKHNLPGKPPYPDIPLPSLEACERSFVNSRIKDESLLLRWRALMRLKMATLSPNTPNTGDERNEQAQQVH